MHAAVRVLPPLFPLLPPSQTAAHTLKHIFLHIYSPLGRTHTNAHTPHICVYMDRPRVLFKMQEVRVILAVKRERQNYVVPAQSSESATAENSRFWRT